MPQTSQKRIMVVSAKPALRSLIVNAFVDSGYVVTVVENVPEVEMRVRLLTPDVLVLDQDVSDDGSVLRVMGISKKHQPPLPLVLLSNGQPLFHHDEKAELFSFFGGGLRKPRPDRFVSRPLEMQVIIEVVSELLSR